MAAAEPIVALTEPPALTKKRSREPSSWLSRQRPAWLPFALLLVAGALVFLPAIRSPAFLDDYFQTSMIEGTYPSPRSPFNLYDFVGDADRAVLMDRGLLPWWSHPRITVRFLRPLSSALLYADHRIFGVRPLPAHLHSFLWWAAAAFAARSLYRRALAPRAALLAVIIFAFAACHALPLVWLAHREVLVSVAFGVLALGGLVRFLHQGSRWHVASATALFGLSLLGGEYGISFAGYALALALAGGHLGAGRLRRIGALLSFAAPAAAYLAVRARLGYGAEGSGLYYDPFREPLVFVEHVPRRLVTLLAEGWLTLDPDAVDLSTPGWKLALIGVIGVALIAVPLRRALVRLDEERRAHATWLLFGSVLSLVPMLSVSPAPRLLGASLLGIAATVAIVLDHAWFPSPLDLRGGASELTGLVALGLGYAHLVHGPATSWLTSRNLRADGLAFVEHAAALRSRVPDVERAEIVLVRGLSGSVFVLPYALDARGTPPARFRILGLVGHVLMLRRDARTIELVAARGRGLFPIGEGNLFRGEGTPLVPGDVIRVPGMTVTVLEVGDAGPRRARFELESALEGSRVWVNDRFDGITDATPPEPGFGKPFDPWPPVEETHTD